MHSRDPRAGLSGCSCDVSTGVQPRATVDRRLHQEQTRNRQGIVCHKPYWRHRQMHRVIDSCNGKQSVLHGGLLRALLRPDRASLRNVGVRLLRGYCHRRRHAASMSNWGKHHAAGRITKTLGRNRMHRWTDLIAFTKRNSRIARSTQCGASEQASEAAPWPRRRHGAPTLANRDRWLRQRFVHDCNRKWSSHCRSGCSACDPRRSERSFRQMGYCNCCRWQTLLDPGAY